MKYIVDADKRSSVIAEVIMEHHRGLSFLCCCMQYLLPVTIAAAILCAAMYLRYPELGLTMVLHGVLIVSFGVIAFYCTCFYISNRTSKDLGERIDESLEIATGIILYSFRVRYHVGRMIIMIPFDDVESVTYDQRTRKLQFTGRISCTVMESDRAEKIYDLNSSNLSEFVIYDYFSPSLYEYLTECGLVR